MSKSSSSAVAAILVQNLSKTFHMSLPGEGWLGSFRRTKKDVPAVEGISFSIQAGERVAFIGPNGAGKSTTIKMLCGILQPSAGKISVLGHTPVLEREALSAKIGIVFGQRSQLWNHLPVRDSFELLLAIYDVDKKEGQKRADALSELLGIQELLATPSGKLSLGERMRCELVGALLHKPSLLFLDEPTIGLDVHARALLRNYIRKISEQEGVTVLLTSHDTADISEVCDRCLLINHGQLLLDQAMQELRGGFLQKKRVQITFGESIAEKKLPEFTPGCQILERLEFSLLLEIDSTKVAIDALIRSLLEIAFIQDINIEDPPLEEVIMRLYREVPSYAR